MGAVTRIRREYVTSTGIRVTREANGLWLRFPDGDLAVVAPDEEAALREFFGEVTF